MTKKAYHGGAFWDGINPDFGSLEKSANIINADVLDAWFDPSPKVIKKVSQFLPLAIKTSPPTHSEGLIKAISEYRKVPENHIVVGGGSSDFMFAFFPNVLLNEAIQSSNPQMLVLVNPNSPTGKYWGKENILKLMESHPSIIFVVDETYIKYVGKEKSIEQNTEKYHNLMGRC